MSGWRRAAVTSSPEEWPTLEDLRDTLASFSEARRYMCCAGRHDPNQLERRMGGVRFKQYEVRVSDPSINAIHYCLVTMPADEGSQKAAEAMARRSLGIEA